MDAQVVERFMEKVEKTECGCWIWTACRNGNGYGQFHCPDADTRMAHRISYQIHTGVPVPKDLVLLHTCDNPSCVNPDHLIPGTHNENMTDMKTKGRAANREGENNTQARLTVADILAIRRATGRNKDIAKRFRISQSHCSNIRARRFWGHV